MKRSWRWSDYVTINSFWFALTTRSQVLTPLVLPLLVQQFVGDQVKGRYVGIARLWSLMIALLAQALFGLLSDQSTSRWGRRRPFIALGTVAELVVLTSIGFVAGMEGMAGYWVLLGLYIGSMIASNAAHAATQGLIPDLVPPERRGLFSGVKAMLELPVPLIFVSLVVGRMMSDGNLWGALVSLMVVLVACMLLTMLVPEEPRERASLSLDWRPFLRLLIMTGAFTAIILGVGGLVGLAIRLSAGWSPLAGRMTVGIVGVVGMGVAVLVGVWSSIRIGLGRESKQSPSFVWWVTNRLAFLIPATNLAGFMLYFMQERFVELSGERAAGPASTVIMFVGVSILFTALPSGWLADRFGKKLLSMASGLLGGVGTFCAILVPSLAGVYVGGCLIGAALGLFYSANWALGTEIVPQDQAGRYLGLSNLAGAGAGAIGAYIGGPIADGLGYVFVFGLYGVLFLISILALAGIRESRPGERLQQRTVGAATE